MSALATMWYRKYPLVHMSIFNAALQFPKHFLVLSFTLSIHATQCCSSSKGKKGKKQGKTREKQGKKRKNKEKQRKHKGTTSGKKRKKGRNKKKKMTSFTWLILYMVIMKSLGGYKKNCSGLEKRGSCSGLGKAENMEVYAFHTSYI